MPRRSFEAAVEVAEAAPAPAAVVAVASGLEVAELVEQGWSSGSGPGFGVPLEQEYQPATFVAVFAEVAGQAAVTAAGAAVAIAVEADLGLVGFAGRRFGFGERRRAESVAYWAFPGRSLA